MDELRAAVEKVLKIRGGLRELIRKAAVNDEIGTVSW